MLLYKNIKRLKKQLAAHANKDADATVTLRRIVRNKDAALKEILGEQPAYDPEHNEDHKALQELVTDLPDKIENRTGGIEKNDRERARHNNHYLLGGIVAIALLVEFYGMQDLLTRDGMPGGLGRVTMSFMGAMFLFGLMATAVEYLTKEDPQDE